MKRFVITIATSALILGSIPGFAVKKVRIVSLAPNLTEIIFQLKRGDCLVGRTSASNYFGKAKDIPIIGDYGIPSIEQLILMKPDIVVAADIKDYSIERTIKKTGMKFYLLPTNSIEKYYDTVKTLGRLLDAEKNAAHEVARIKNGLKNCMARIKSIPEKKRPSVLWVIWDPPLMTLGKRSFLNDFIHYAGGHNIAASENKRYFNVSREWVLGCSPEVIIAPSMGNNKISQLRKQFGWKPSTDTKNTQNLWKFGS